jgi:hypothetical protein
MTKEFETELCRVINQNSVDNELNVADYKLARMVCMFLSSYVDMANVAKQRVNELEHKLQSIQDLTKAVL